MTGTLLASLLVIVAFLLSGCGESASSSVRYTAKLSGGMPTV